MRTLATKQTAINQYNGLGNQLWDLSGQRPTLDLRFAEDRTLVDATTGSNLVTHTRQSIATYVGSDGLIKTATTNLLLQSEDFSTTWGLAKMRAFGSGSTVNAVIAPDGTLTADHIVEDTSTGNHNIGQAVAVVSGSVYSISVYAKAPAQARQLQILVASTNFTVTPAAIFDVSTGSVVLSANGTASMVPVGNGWYRCQLTTIPATSSGNNGFNFRFYDGTTNNYTGDDTSGLYLWGAQLEESSTVGQYVKTTTAKNGAPRFDHEVTRTTTNFIPYSEAILSNALSGPNRTIVDNTVLAPDGALTAATVTATGADPYVVISTLSGASAGTYTFSVYLKGHPNNSSQTCKLRIQDAGTGLQTSSSFDITGEWDRYSFTATTTGDLETVRLDIPDVAVSGDIVYVWGFQIEANADVGPYVKTTGAAATQVSTESLGLLVEESGQNLLEYSEDISQWSSTTGGSPTITPNAATAPDGTNTATLIENTGVTAFIGDVTSYTSGTTYTFSGYFKANDGDKVAILLYSSGGSSGFWNSETSNVATTFDLTNGTFTTFPGGVAPTTSTITDAGNGWWRCSITATATATSNSANQLIRNMSGVTEGIYAWGYQIEAGSFPTSYIPTEGSTVTRAADVASITGTNFSSWYEQDEGTVFTDTVNKETYPGTNVFPYILQIDDGTNNNRIGYDNSVLNTGYRYNLFCTSGGVAQGELNQFGFASGAARWASAFKTNDFALAINLSPSVLSTRTSGTLPNTMTQLQIGKGFGKQFNGTIRRLTYWPTRLSNDTLQTITT